MNRRLSMQGLALHDKCAKAMADWEGLEEPADIEDAVHKFIPTEEPKRSEAIETIAKMMSVNISKMADDTEMVDAIACAATARVVRKEQTAGRRSSYSASMSGGVSLDDTLDMIKLIIVGDSGVGKTCLMLRFIKDEFVTSTRATVGMDFCTRQLSVDLLSASESSVVQRLTVQVWDTAGQEQYGALVATYYRKAGGVMIVYDAHVRKTFESLPKWLEQVDDNAEGIVKMIVAAKSEGEVAVSEEEGRAFAAAHGCLFSTTSSKLGDGVLPAFKALSSHVLAAEEQREEQREGLWLHAPVPERAPKRGCC